MKQITTNKFCLRINNIETIETLNKVLKLQKSNSINKTLNDALEIGLPLLLDTEMQATASFAEKLEKNTNRILSKINRTQTELHKDMLKTLIIQSSIESLCNFLVNNNIANMSDSSFDKLKTMAQDQPQFILEEKEKLINQVFGEEDNE